MLKTSSFGRRISDTVTTFRRPGRPTSKVCPVCHALECLCRPRYFSGQLLTDDDLNAEQQYVIRKNQLHNLYLHGWGVVCGLQVVCHDTCAGWVTVDQGYAISPCGDDIVVCENRDFDVLAAIDDCLRQRAQAQPTDCTPRANVKADCDPDGVWCLTIRYQETASRAVTSLRAGQEGGTKACSCGPASSCDGSCGCSGSGGGGCGCGCGGGASGGGRTSRSKSSSRGGGCTCGCGSKSTSTVATGPARPQCEPTRWCEGYELELCQQDTGVYRPSYRDVLGGTLYGNLYECFTDVVALMRTPDPQGSAYDRYTSFSSMQAEVLRFLTAHHSTRCDLLDAVRNAGLAAPHSSWGHVMAGQVTPAYADAGAYHEAVDVAVTAVHGSLWTLFMECVCLQLLPPCPTDPGDDRLTLACIRVEGGRIVEICNFERKQVVTFPALLWWLSALPIGPVFGAALERICCGGFAAEGVGRLFGGTDGATLSAGHFGQPADTKVMAEQLGALFATVVGGGSFAQGGK